MEAHRPALLATDDGIGAIERSRGAGVEDTTNATNANDPMIEPASNQRVTEGFRPDRLSSGALASCWVSKEFIIIMSLSRRKGSVAFGF
mmetsp:Transcript_11946/g.16698  ORF Transcript_11946/g.16698 Transcript_11946/m.16698 type:complete len:89 (-) Transcript_11946:131-397(-)